MQIARATILMQDLVTLAVIFMRKRLDAVLKLFEALIYTIPFKVKKQWQNTKQAPNLWLVLTLISYTENQITQTNISVFTYQIFRSQDIYFSISLLTISYHHTTL